MANHKRKKNKNRKARIKELLGKWGRGGSSKNKIYYSG